MIKVGVILDGSKVARWQADALEPIAGEAEFVAYSCTTPAPARRQARHALYYLLNLFTVRNRLTRRVALSSVLPTVEAFEFAAPSDGLWQSLPSDLLDRIAADRPDVLVKFGMGLLRVPPPDRLAAPILSYHHGDPALFRGRPAGFYELAQGQATIGQIVQVLSNRLDSGRIAASAETKAIAHSYRATLVLAYRHSRLLLAPAVRNVIAGTTVQPGQLGPAYRLPENRAVARFVFGRLRAAWAHLSYGLTGEKRWSVWTAPVPDRLTLCGLTDRLADEAEWTAVPAPPWARFLADPFFDPDDGLLVEAMSASSGRGAIVHLGSEPRRLSGPGGHFSFPAVADRWVVPEVSEWSSALAFPLGDNGLGEPVELDIPGRPRLLDPTPLRHGDALYLFGNIASEGPSVLRLWLADSIEGKFAEHPASPVRISPNGARMAGIPLSIGDDLIRVGQDLRRSYGDGISFFRVTRLDRRHYEEEGIGTFRFADRRGPHTLNLARGQMAFDHYEDSFSLLAGLRRWRERRAARRIGD